jgi:hypothetical protein
VGGTGVPRGGCALGGTGVGVAGGGWGVGVDAGARVAVAVAAEVGEGAGVVVGVSPGIGLTEVTADSWERFKAERISCLSRRTGIRPAINTLTKTRPAMSRWARPKRRRIVELDFSWAMAVAPF